MTVLSLALLSLTLTAVLAGTCSDPNGQCCYSINDFGGGGSQTTAKYCKQVEGSSCDLFKDAYAPGECDELGYSVGCVCRYDIRFWFKESECDQCLTNSECHLDADDKVKCTGPPPDKYCFHVDYDSKTFPKGYCRQADGDDCDTFKSYYQPGTCQDITPYPVACRNVNDQFMIDFWVSIDECSICQQDKSWIIQDDPLNKCEDHPACCKTKVDDFPFAAKSRLIIAEEIVEE